jgi:hypothetical protein
MYNHDPTTAQGAAKTMKLEITSSAIFLDTAKGGLLYVFLDDTWLKPPPGHWLVTHEAGLSPGEHHVFLGRRLRITWMKAKSAREVSASRV